MTERTELDVAVVGMACRFPGAPDLKTYWHNLISGINSIEILSEAELLSAGVSAEQATRDDYVPARGVVDGVDRFDAEFFHFSPAEAALLDPQQRVFLELAWEAFEHAGCDPHRAGASIGVFAGQSLSTYLTSNLLGNPEVARRHNAWDIGMANEKDMLSMRVAYKLGLTGPAVTIQTACSTSLVAVHAAIQSLLNYECHVALAGGVSISIPQGRGYSYEAGGILSPDGVCRPFDDMAAGTVFGSGAGAIVLMRLEDALAGGYTIHAVVKGSAINNDGGRKAGFTAPSAEGQIEVVRQALNVSGLQASDIGYVEAHGTGTQVGDPIEWSALAAVFEKVQRHSCLIGSVKGNIGHLDNAAGIAGLIKAILAVQHGVVPATLHYVALNRHVADEGGPFKVCTAATRWPAHMALRRAGVSSFGIGGTNAHVVIEQAPPLSRAEGGVIGSHLLVLSAATPGALNRQKAQLAVALEADVSVRLEDVAGTLRHGRREQRYRWAAAAAGLHHAVIRLREVTQPIAAVDRPRLVFMFPGQGSQYPGMAASLHRNDIRFRRHFDRCADVIAQVTGHRIAVDSDPHLPAHVSDAIVTQLTLFAVEHAMAETWLELGVRPDACVGHSLGEYAAACCAGVLTCQQAARMIQTRAVMMQESPQGATLVAEMSLEAAMSLVKIGQVDIAAINGPRQIVLAGFTDAIKDLEQQLQSMDVSFTRLDSRFGFHSPTMEMAIAPFAQAIANERPCIPILPLVSNATGHWMTPDEARDPSYWARHLRATVRFEAGLLEAGAGQPTVFLEVGPGRTLSGLVQARMSSEIHAISTMPSKLTADAEGQAFVEAIGSMWCHGFRIDWPALSEHYTFHRVPLPTYPFERRRHWLEPSGDPLPLRLKPVHEEGVAWFVPVWLRELEHQAPQASKTDRDAPWLLLHEGSAFAKSLGDAIKSAGFSCETGASSALGGPEHRRTGQVSGQQDLIQWLRSIGQRHRSPPRRCTFFVDSCGGGTGTLNTIVALLQAWRKAFGDAPLDLSVVTRDGVSIAGECEVNPIVAMLHALSGVVVKEYAQIRCRFIDVTPQPLDRLHQTVRALFDELQHSEGPPWVALRGSARWVRKLQPRPPARVEGPTPLRYQGVYLVTGGFGDIGLELAEALVGRAQARLILIGRTNPTVNSDASQWHARAAARIQQLVDAGAEVLALTADASDGPALTSAIDLGIRRFGRIDGVFHAAAAASDTLFHEASPERARDSLRAKVDATMALEAALDGMDIDFLVLFSSVATFDSHPGQLYYAVGNAFLDAFAQARHLALPFRVVSIAWGAWQGVGMSHRLRQSLAEGRASDGRRLEHPVLNRTLRGLSAEHIVLGQLDVSRHWMLNEHIVAGHAVLPGVASLELTRVAFEAITGCGEPLFEEVRFPAPLRLEKDGTSLIIIAFEGLPDARRFTVLARTTGAKALIACATGKIRPAGFQPADLPNSRSGWTAVDAMARLASTLEYVSLGERWNCIEHCYTDGQRWDMSLRLPSKHLDDLNVYRLHPALLDGCWSAVRLACNASVLPFAVDSIAMYRPLTASVRAQLTVVPASGNVVRADVKVFDDQEHLAVEVSGVSFARVTPEFLDRFQREASDSTASAGLMKSLEALDIEGRISLAVPDAMQALWDAIGGTAEPELVVTANPEAIATSERPFLQALQRSALVEANSSQEPADAIRTLVAVFADTLDSPTFGADDNFFTAGGDSLKAIRVVSRARESGLSFSIATLFEHPTARALAAHLELADGPNPQQPMLERFALVPENERDQLPAGVEEAYPLASLQAGAMFHRQHAPGEAIYHDVLAVIFSGGCEVGDLQQAIDGVVRNHPALRTSFDMDGFSEPMQLVWREAEMRLREVDLRGAKEPRLALDQWIAVELESPLEERYPPLLRCFLLRLTDQENTLVLSIDDALLDGWSAASLATEILEALDCRMAIGKPIARPRPLAYRDFVAAERVASADPVQRSYWKEVVSRAVPTVLPRRADIKEGHRVSTLSVALLEHAAVGVARLANGLGVPVKYLLLAVHLRVLGLVAHRDDVVSGLETNGRLEQEGGDLTLGLHLNTLPLVLRLQGESWRDLIELVAQTERSMLPMRRFPLSAIARMQASAPLFDVVFNFTHFHIYERGSSMQALRMLDVKGRGQTHYPLRAEFNVDHGSGSVRLFLEYNECQLDRAGIEALGRTYNDVLCQLVKAPDGPWRQIGTTFQGQLPPPLCPAPTWSGGVLAAIERKMRESSQAVAVESLSEQLSYGALARRSQYIANSLIERGVVPGDRVGLCLRHGVDAIVALIGVLKAGAAYVPMDPAYPIERLARLVHASRPKLLLAEASGPYLHDVPQMTMPGPSASASPRGGLHASILPAYVICTSGTTGAPKPVVVTHGALWSSNEARRIHYGPCEGTFLMTSPLAFDSSVAGLFWTLASGGTLLIAPADTARDAEAIAQTVSTRGVSHWLTVPELYAEVLDIAPPKALSSLRTVIVAGDTCRRSLVTRHHACMPQASLHNEYGPTEATVWSTVHLCEAAEGEVRNSVPIGMAISGVQVRVCDRQQQELVKGIRGEICIGGMNGALGYLASPGATASRFLPDSLGEPGARLYRSGDLGWFDEVGCLHFVGRADHQLKIRGFRVEPGDIECALRSISGVREAVVLSEDHGAGRARLVAYVTCDASPPLVEGVLREELARRVPEHMVPSLLHICDSLIRDENGKLNRSALRDKAERQARSRIEEVVDLVKSMSAAQVERALGR